MRQDTVFIYTYAETHFTESQQLSVRKWTIWVTINEPAEWSITFFFKLLSAYVKYTSNFLRKKECTYYLIKLEFSLDIANNDKNVWQYIQSKLRCCPVV